MNQELHQFLQTAFTHKRYGKGSVLVRQGQICKELFYVEKGLLKICSLDDGREFIMRFFPENSFVTVVDSFTEQSASRFEMVALEDVEVFAIHHTGFEAACAENPAIANMFRKINQWVATNMMKRIRELLENDASRRYQNFIEQNGDILQRISLGDLAKYIGVTQVSLSRIRAQK
jgi:CRP/FNR family transcriptional regulator, anaerobic regulatory protein